MKLELQRCRLPPRRRRLSVSRALNGAGRGKTRRSSEERSWSSQVEGDSPDFVAYRVASYRAGTNSQDCIACDPSFQLTLLDPYWRLRLLVPACLPPRCTFRSSSLSLSFGGRQGGEELGVPHHGLWRMDEEGCRVDETLSHSPSLPSFAKRDHMQSCGACVYMWTRRPRSVESIPWSCAWACAVEPQGRKLHKPHTFAVTVA
jgi:hypothetical protein